MEQPTYSLGFKILILLQLSRAPERSQDPLESPTLPESLESSRKLEPLLFCQSLRHLLDAVYGCLHRRSSENLPNCLGIIKMQTILRLHNSTCKCVSGWPWLIKSPHLGSWKEYRFEDNTWGLYGNQHHFVCMLQPSLSFVVHLPSSCITTPWNYSYL